MITPEEPLTRSLVSVTKKYLALFAEHVKELGLERYHFVLLRIHDNHEQLTQKALSELMQIDKSSMVNITDYLSDRGYVYREQNLRDRREQLIRLTDKAREEIPVIRQSVKRLNEQSLANISETELITFEQVLNTIQANLSGKRTEILLDFKELATE